MVALSFGVVVGVGALGMGFPPDSRGGSDEGGREGRRQWC
jgi:hypothetical protein